MKLYRTLRRIWHSKERCYYAAGANVDLQHLNAQGIENLINLGTVEEIKQKHVKKVPQKRQSMRKADVKKQVPVEPSTATPSNVAEFFRNGEE